MQDGDVNTAMKMCREFMRRVIGDYAPDYLALSQQPHQSSCDVFISILIPCKRISVKPYHLTWTADIAAAVLLASTLQPDIYCIYRMLVKVTIDWHWQDALTWLRGHTGWMKLGWTTQQSHCQHPYSSHSLSQPQSMYSNVTLSTWPVTDNTFTYWQYGGRRGAGRDTQVSGHLGDPVPHNPLAGVLFTQACYTPYPWRVYISITRPRPRPTSMFTAIIHKPLSTIRNT